MTHQDRDLLQLPNILARRTNDPLLRMARRFTGKPPVNKRDLVAFLVDRTRPPALRSTLDLAGEDECRILAHAAHGNGLLRSARTAVPGVKLGSWERDWHDRKDQQKPSVVLLFFPDGIAMPPALRQPLAALLPAPPMPALAALAGLPPGESLAGDAEADLGVVLESARAGQLAVTRSGPSTASLRRLAASLSCPSRHADVDLLRMRCLTMLLTAAGWLRRTATSLEAGRGGPDRQALRALFRAYRAWQYDELHDLPALRGVGDDDPLISEPVARRSALLEVLGRCPVGAWMDAAGFARHAAATAALDPLLDEDCGVSIGRGYYGSMPELGDAGMTAVCHSWMRLVLACYLAPLGIVDISLAGIAALPPMDADFDNDSPDCISPADRLAAFRLTPLGAWLLGIGAAPPDATAQPGGWRIQADGSVVSLGERVPPAERVLLDRIAKRCDERSWRLERSRLIAAIAGGDQSATVRARLEKLAGGAVPDTIARLIDDAGRRATAVRVEEQLIMLRVEDPLAREQLLFDRSTRALCRDCGGTLVGVRPAALTALRRAARTLGWHIPDHHGS